MIDRATDAYNAGRWDEAAALCAQVLAAQPSDPDALLILGSIYANRGESESAAPLLSRALASGVADANYLHALGAALNSIGYLDEARDALEKAAAAEPRSTAILHALGNVLLRLGERPGAKACFERVIALDATFAPAIAGLATLAMSANQLDEAERQARRVLDVAPDYGAALVTLADAALRRDAPEQSLEHANSALATKLSRSQRVVALNVKGHALERLQRFDEAFAAFEEANKIDDALYSARYEAHRHASSPHAVAELEAQVRTAAPARWPRPSGAIRAPVFLIGFPRSGTTLLGQMLGSHPSVETLDESENFSDATNALLLPQPALGSWPDLDAGPVDALRAKYWSRAEQALGHAPARPVFVDKMPMNIVALPLIRLLFPDAKVLLILRDPRDVVMSCFKQRFAPNPATVQFLRLDQCVAYYDVVMRLLETARGSLGLDMHTIRYEALAQDYRPVVTEALQHLRLGWDDAIERYAETAAQSRILTPSAFAATQPVNIAAVGAWRRYERQLAPYLPQLEEWARKIDARDLG